MNAVLVLNGDPPDPGRLRELAARWPVYAADGGALACSAAGVRPELVAGDFDSVDPDSLPETWTLRRTPDQALTDFEKLLRCLPGEVDDLTVLGGLGKRLDHLITNLLAAAALPAGVAVRFEDRGQELIRVTPKRPLEFAPRAEIPLSLLPIAAATGVTTTGLRWNLDDADMGPGVGLGQSNRVVGPVRVGIRGGTLFVWNQRSAS